MSEEWLIEKKISVRPHEDGSFDELLMYQDDECIVHAEMMDKDCLWIGFYPPGEQNHRRVVMWIHAKGGKLKIRAEED